MNTRILRMAPRSLQGIRLVRSLGQLQPVAFSINRGGLVQFSCEDVEGGRACIRRCPLPYQKRLAKRLFAELEQHRQAGTRSAAWAAHFGDAR